MAPGHRRPAGQAHPACPGGGQHRAAPDPAAGRRLHRLHAAPPAAGAGFTAAGCARISASSNGSTACSSAPSASRRCGKARPLPPIRPERPAPCPRLAGLAADAAHRRRQRLRLHAGRADLRHAAAPRLWQPAPRYPAARRGLAARRRHRSPSRLELLFARHLFCRYGCSVGILHSLAWMSNSRALVVGTERSRLAECASCLDGQGSACDAVCPMRLKPRSLKRWMFSCTQCGLCIDACATVNHRQSRRPACCAGRAAMPRCATKPPSRRSTRIGAAFP